MRTGISPQRHKDTKVPPRALQTATCKLQTPRTVSILHFVIFTLSLVFFACNTLPVGYDQLRDRVTGTADTTMLPDTASSYSRYVPLGGASMLYLGQDTSYRSRLIIRFTIPDTLSLDSMSFFLMLMLL